MYAGSLDGSAEASTTPLVTYTGGTWVAGTGVFTVASGDPVAAGVAVGHWASVYPDGTSTSTPFVGRVTARTTTTITVSLTAKSGTAPTDGTGNRTLVVGGAWAGPNGASGFPFGFVQSTMTNASSHPPRVNLKNDQTYASTAAWSHANNGPMTFQGYASAFDDGGRWTQTVAVGASYIPLTQGGNNVTLKDFVINASAFTSGTSANFSAGATTLCERGVSFGGRGSGFLSTSSNVRFVGCEAYSYGAAGTQYGFDLNSGGVAVRCVAHDTNGANCGGFRGSTGLIEDCISDTVSGSGFLFGQNNTGPGMRGCVSYNATSHGVSITGASLVVVENCIFANSGGYGVNAGSTVPPQLVNNAYRSNTSGETNGTVESSGSVTLTGDPFVDAADGDFRLNNTAGAGAACRGAGRGSFLQTQTGYGDPNPTLGYPDIGAAQHQDAGGGGGSVAFPVLGRLIG